MVSFEAPDLEVRQKAAFLGGRLWPSGTAGVCLPPLSACFFPGADIKGWVRIWEHEKGLQCSPLSSLSTLPVALLVSGIFWNTEQTLQC